ncbi:conserved protein of unknown function [Rhodovastum atsumiense]|nr:DUF2497 domain-containing protein [Rhodovastum atsumiense]CAH2599100.1 conserved protein of unknown function [Rhodovastum atsumiense]
MNASNPPGQTPAPQTAGGNADPSMEDILASIRRILNEDEAASASRPAQLAAPAAPDQAEILALDASMIISDPSAASAAAPSGGNGAASPPVEPPPAVAVAAPAVNAAPATGLVAPDVAAAASSALGALVRTLGERSAATPPLAIHRGGPTVEEVVREELRPLLKAWLDENLPPLVERLVRLEIERLVGRSLS